MFAASPYLNFYFCKIILLVSQCSENSCGELWYQSHKNPNFPVGSFGVKATKIPVSKVSACTLLCYRWWSQLVCKEKGKTAKSSCFWVSTEMAEAWGNVCPEGIKEIISPVWFMVDLFSHQSVLGFHIPAWIDIWRSIIQVFFPATFPLNFPSFQWPHNWNVVENVECKSQHWWETQFRVRSVTNVPVAVKSFYF